MEPAVPFEALVDLVDGLADVLAQLPPDFRDARKIPERPASLGVSPCST